MKNDKAYNVLESIMINNPKLKIKGTVNRGWGYMSLAETPNLKVEIADETKLRKLMKPYYGKFNIWYRTSSKYITVYMENLDYDKLVKRMISYPGKIKL